MTFAIVYLQYFASSHHSGDDPGMMMRGLQVSAFRASRPRPDKRFCAARAYLLSAELFFLDSCWAMWTKMNLPGTNRLSPTHLSPAQTFAILKFKRGAQPVVSLEIRRTCCPAAALDCPASAAKRIMAAGSVPRLPA